MFEVRGTKINPEGGREDAESRSSFLRHLKERGIRGVRLVTSDKSLGLLEVLPHFFPEASWQRCVVHFYRNVYSAVSRGKVREVALTLKAIHSQEDLTAAREKAEAVIPEDLPSIPGDNKNVLTVCLCSGKATLSKGLYRSGIENSGNESIVGRQDKPCEVGATTLCRLHANDEKPLPIERGHFSNLRKPAKPLLKVDRPDSTPFYPKFNRRVRLSRCRHRRKHLPSQPTLLYTL